MIEKAAYAVAWSSLLDGPVTSLSVDGRDVFVASGHDVVHLSEDGEVKWSHRLRTSVYQVKVAGDTVAALSGPDMWLLDRKDGEPRLDSRRVPGGFRCVSARPSGGWLAADRGDHLHLFAEIHKPPKELEKAQPAKAKGFQNVSFLITSQLGTFFNPFMD